MPNFCKAYNQVSTPPHRLNTLSPSVEVFLSFGSHECCMKEVNN
nr:MAG TPA: hypothetical protein [Caudoviricetes sp.]